LPAAFPGWRLPLPKPVRREVRDIFGEVSVIETCEPEWPDDEDEPMDQKYQVVSSSGRYEDYLEGRIPRFVQSQSHWCGKGLTEVELEKLVKSAGVEGSFEFPLYAPPSSGAMLQETPPSLTARLASLEHRGMEALAQSWAAAMSMPEHTQSVTGVKLSDGWTTSEAMSLLEPIAALAREATGGKGMYLLVEA
jgi:hypothetical protein